MTRPSIWTSCSGRPTSPRRDLALDYVNFLHPVRKLVSKTRSGARMTRRYDDARTPFDRLLASGSLSADAESELKEHYAATKPVRLKLQMEAALKYNGDEHKFVMGEEGHNGKHGGAILPESLKWLWRPESKK